MKFTHFLYAIVIWSVSSFAVIAHDLNSASGTLSAESAQALQKLQKKLVDAPIPFIDPRFAVNKEAFDFDEFVSEVGKKSELGIQKPKKAGFFGKGDVSETYDVIIQSGHFLRKRCCGNKTGSSGKYFYEQDYVAYISSKVAALLAAKKEGGKPKYKVLMIGADNYNSPLKAGIFLSLHLDGANQACSVSASLGYDDVTDLLGAHTMGMAIASALGINYDEFTQVDGETKDNYTTGLSNYYAFDDIRTTKFEAVLELSELSCEKQEIRLAGATSDLIKNLAAGIEYILELEVPQ